MSNIINVLLDATGQMKDLNHPIDPKRLRKGAVWLGRDGEGSGKVTVARLPKGMQSGRSAVAIRLDYGDGKTVVAELSMRNFQIAAKAFMEADRLDGVADEDIPCAVVPADAGPKIYTGD